MGFEDPNTLVIHPDRPRRWEAWDLDRDYTDARIPQTDEPVEIRVVESDPLRGVIETRRRIGRSSSLVQRHVLESGSRVLRIENILDWHEDQSILRAEFAPTIRTRRATYGTQYGFIERSTHANTSWDKAAFEVPGHLWMDCSEPGRGLAVIDDGTRFGRSCRDGVMGLSLVRSTSFPDPGADRGRHEFAYGLMAHGGDWRRAGVDLEAEAFGSRLRTMPAPSGASGAVKDRWSILRDLENELAVEVSACKPPESGEGMLLRLVERRGGRGTVRFRLPEGFTNARLVDLHEQALDEEEPPIEDGVLTVRFDPHQIRSILMK